MSKSKNENDRNYVNLQVNPCKMCMPMGASMALRGFSNTTTIIHGSQGCSTYIRRHMAAHYNEPIDIASSSLSEEGTVYGGSKNLKIGVHNLVSMYKPEIVGVLTTCLAETIGDDIQRIVREIYETEEYKGVDIIPIPTPGYGGSEAEGYFAAILGIVKYYCRQLVEENDLMHHVVPKYEDEHINIIVSNATCEDIRELKKIIGLFGIEAIFIPDISEVLDAPYTQEFNKLSQEGTTRKEIRRVANAKATIELGDLVAPQYSPALFLEEVYAVKAYRMPLPIGINNTDRFVETIASIYRVDIPKELQKERGRLIDAMIDSHKHSALGEMAVFGDMDLVHGISSLLLENGAKVRVAATGALTSRFKERMERLLSRYEQESVILQDSDFETIRQVIKEENVNLMVGNSDGKFIWEKDHVDFIRVGFPVHDHIGAQRKKRMGYKGSVRLLDEIVNHLLDQKHSGYRERMYDQYFPRKKEDTLC